MRLFTFKFSFCAFKTQFSFKESRCYISISSFLQNSGSLSSSAHSLLHAARIGVGRIDSLIAVLSIFPYVVKSVTQCTICCYALFVDCLTPTEKTFSLGADTMLAAICMENQAVFSEELFTYSFKYCNGEVFCKPKI